MVEALDVRVADVHARAQADGFQPFQDADAIFVVLQWLIGCVYQGNRPPNGYQNPGTL
jgi:hypothetical protein